jgi:serine-type D-Ala-D-Ala carboxypeptidase/endopeptidase (penicillin-binding protein 4)
VELHQRLLLILAVCGQAAWAASPSAALAQLSRLAADGAAVSALVWDLDSDQAIAQLGATERLAPASLSKIVIAAAALDTWAPDFSFATELRSATAPVNGVLAGDLVLRGSGDATLDETTLWGLAAQLRAAGIRRVTGNLLVERAPFGELTCDTIDRCNGLRRSSRAYNAAPSAVGVNYGSWCISVRAAAVARVATVGGCATGEAPIPITGTVQVANGGAALGIERTTDAGGDRISVSGSIAPGSERQVHRAMSDPAAGAGIILRSILRQTGVSVDGKVETTALPVTAVQLLAKVDGLPVQEQVGRMMRYSNNYIADVLTMGVALSRSGQSPRSLAAAAQTLGELVRNANGEKLTADQGPLLESGSGLTTSNRLSATDLVNVLRREYRDSRRFPAFYGAFVAPGDASFAYLRAGNADWQQRVALKTGSLTEPISVNGIAGYLRKRNGGWMAFAIIVNGTNRRQLPHDQALRAQRSAVEAVLAAY